MRTGREGSRHDGGQPRGGGDKLPPQEIDQEFESDHSGRPHKGAADSVCFAKTAALAEECANAWVRAARFGLCCAHCRGGNAAIFWISVFWQGSTVDRKSGN